ncbi:uncharacterized protein LY89DRAFT_723650 [Mollisia scopiformis]|uniref:Uncharacterized protein n=1 Tax=Mollisia scopiformis TaxID=149040 RepID=A0A132BDE0_MOLSC|nr:uncharacterized protein LY89DRAFT_723650 [Mollisia scopiformis]KUJ10445.1 hypothetical protein LY89DRAFT_723650 [Mollisia scopiformis]
MTQGQLVSASHSAEELVPWLLKSPSIVQQLGICVTIACTRDVAQIRLNTDGLPSLRDDLASNLIRIADAGGEAFEAAYSSLSDISSVTKQMSKENGLLDKLEDRVLNRRSQRDATACQNIINRIDTYIQRSTDHGLTTQEDFDKFAKFVKQVKEALLNAQSRENTKLVNTQRHIENMDMEKTQQEKVFRQSEWEAKEAAVQYNTILERYNGRASWLGNSMAWTVGASTAGAAALGVAATVATAGVAGVAILGGLIAGAISAGKLEEASRGLNVVEDRLSEKRRARDALELQIASFEGELKLLESSKDKLERATTVIAKALSLLTDLAKDISQLMIRFRDLNQAIRELVDQYSEGKELAGYIQESIEEGEHPDLRDMSDFREKISDMRKVSVIIRCLSDLYATVIRDVVIPGFGQAIEMSNGNILDQSIEQVIRDKELLMRSYVEDSDLKCRAMAQKSSAMLSEELSRARRLESRSNGGLPVAQ